MDALKKWHEDEYLPWKKAMEARADERVHTREVLRKNAEGVKKVAALVLNAEVDQACEVWNTLGLEPKLKALKVDLAAKEITLTTAQGRISSVSIEGLFNDLQALLK